jgi:UDP-N-acetylmuramoyl-tripeptide--D-alanyl-D-alanine ligase
MNLQHLYDVFLRSTGVTTDTRRVEKGQLFFALRGENFNGNRYTKDALNGGAIAAVIDDPDFAIAGETILVPDVLEALQQLAHHHRMQFDIPVFAITGSNGKTTSKELCSRVLSKKFNALSTIGNLNNHIGVPLTLLSINSDTEIAVVEMGANHQGEIALLCRIAAPTHGLICSIGKAHIEGFGGLEGVKKGKGEMYDYLLAHGGTLFINLATPHLAAIWANRPGKVAQYGVPGKFPYGEILDEQPFVSGTIYLHEQQVEVRSHLIGAYNFTNIVNAFAVGDHFGISPEEMAEAVGSYLPDNNRSQLVQKNGYQVILDAYNANPTSLSHAIASFDRRQEARKVLIIGDMFELGEDAAKEHQAIVDQVKSSGIETVALVGPLFSATNHPPQFLTFPDAVMAAAWWKTFPKAGCLALLKGSRGMQMEKVVSE